LRRNLDKEQRGILVKQSIADLAIQASATLAVIVSYAFIAYQTALGVITLGGLVMYYQAFQRGQGFLQDIISSLTDLYENNLFVSSLFEFLDQQPRITSPASPRPVPKPMRSGITFENVGFQYPASPRKAINKVSFTIRPGEVVALVGANGAGKTTLIKLLCRLYDPDEGRITIDGIDLREFDVTALRREISVIFQDYIHYHTTARENVWFGNIETPPDQQAINAAAQLAGIDEKLSGLKSGYDTVLGKWFEDGEELSIGEWQKVALARAFMRNAQLIVLDEPTSAMDAEAEYEIFSRFKSLISGKSAILISHRLSTVKMADRIYVVEHGTILESGTHDELMSQGARYAHLFETQAQFYN
jgi:ATP-binding cassette subfamily B protein